MKTTASFILFILNLGFIWAQDVKVFDGYIDKYPVQMYLNFDGAKVDGYYFYKRFGQPISIFGESKNKQLKLSEQPGITGTSDSETGGTFLLNENYSGSWKSKDKDLHVTLNEIKCNIKWGNFRQKVELTHTFPSNNQQAFPIEISIETPDEKNNQELLNLMIPEILGVKRESFSSTWDFFNKYVLNSFSEYLEYFSDNNPSYYEISMRGMVVSITDSILNYKTSGYVYQGGAHGYGFEYFYIFDLKKMKRLMYNDIFKPNTKPAIAKLLYEQDKKEHKLEDFEKNLENIYLTSKGIGFFFNPYQLDCYACGTFNYFLNFSEIQQYIKE